MSIRTEEYSFNNKIIYKHYCTTMNDLYNIPEIQITLGSIAYINNEKTFIANSNHTWNIIDETSAKTINDDSVYICEEGEYDNNFIPTIEEPSTEIIYLVPTNNEANHQYNEYKWADNDWILIGIRTINTTVNIRIPIGGTAGQKLTKINNEDYNMEWANESDPTISNWAKAETKPSYTATEVGALPNSTFIPTKTSDLTNDSNFITDSQLPSMNDYYNKTEVDNIIQDIEEDINNASTNDIIVSKEIGPDSIISITNAAQFDALNVTVDIEPVQDLHGYDEPWPAGGGKNLADFQNSDNADRSWFTYTTETAQKIQCTCNSTSKFFARFVANVENGVTYKFYKSAYTIAGENYVTPIYIYSDELWGTNIASFTIGLSSNTATWTSNITGTVVIGIYAVTGTLNNEIILSDFMMIANSETDYTFAPYSNICPITGWTGAQVMRKGKNLLGPIATGTRTHSGVTFTANADGSVSLSGTASSNVSYWLNTTNVNDSYRYPIAERTQYTLSGCPSGGSTSTYRLVGYVDIGTTYANRALSDVGSGSSANTSGMVFDSIRVMIDIKSGTVCDGLVFWPQIELGSAATDYEPYNGEIYSITFPSAAGTVCGGTLDVTNGKLTVESVLWTKNTSTMDNGEAYPGWRNAGIAAILGTGLNSIITTVANIGTRIGINTSTANSGDVLFLNPNDYGKTETEWKALAMDVQVVLPLATPVEYALTPQEIALLRETNNIWADCGDTTLRYFLLGVEDIINEIDTTGIPAGGTTGQVLKKASATDYDMEWGNTPSGLPSGGSAGKALIKNSGTDYDVIWGDANTEVIKLTTSSSSGISGPFPWNMPTGGTAGQVLIKDSSTDYDVTWGDMIPKDISSLTTLPQAPVSSDLLAIRSGSSTYKVSYQDLAGSVIKEWIYNIDSINIPTSGTAVTLGYPTGYVSGTNRILAVLLERAWPLQVWNNGAIVIINNMSDYINENTGGVNLTTTYTQNYNLVFRILWI